METKQGSKNKKWWKVFLGISTATIVAAVVGVGIGYAIWHKTKNPTPTSPSAETSFNVSCTNPNLIYGFSDHLSLTWNSANFTPTSITLKDGDSNNNWNLAGGNYPVSSTLTLARKSQTLAVDTYPVTFVASDGNNEKEATITVRIVAIPSTYYIGINTNNDIISGPVTATLNLSSLFLKYLYTPPNSVIQNLDCSSNRLAQLDVSNNSQLQVLDCSSNYLTQLDVSNNSQLQVLNCSSNYLTQLDVSNNSQLQGLSCSSNKLSQLDVSKNTLLNALDCSSNLLDDQLDVSNNSQLQYLGCTSNQLQQLDVSKNTQLGLLYCTANQLTQLDVSSNSVLTVLYCYSNPLNLIKLPANKTSGSFTFTTASTINDWTASGYAATGDIYCNASLTINNLPHTWRENP